MKSFYEIIYRYFRAPWDIGPRRELVELVEAGRLRPCKAVDLGSGTASNCIFLARHGFEVTGIDFASAAVELGRRRAAEAGVEVNFLQDDLTRLQHVTGTFDLLVDYSTLDDLRPPQRSLYVQNVLPLTHPGSQFLLVCFEWAPRWWEWPYIDSLACRPGEIHQRFGTWFEIERFRAETGLRGLPHGWAAYLMRRNERPA